MTSLPFPDSGSRQVLYSNGDFAVNASGTLYADEALTTLAEVYEDASGAPGPRITTAQLTLDAYGRQPDYWGPTSGTTRLWITVNGGPAAQVDADYGARLDAIPGTYETPGGAQTKADAARTAATGAAAALAIVFGA